MDALNALPFNVPIISIALYYGLAIVPHAYGINIATKGKVSSHQNRNPKGSEYQEALRKKLNPRALAAFERAQSCHRNHLENMPLYVATVFAGLLAEQKAGADAVGLQLFVVGWLTIRALYTANYLTSETETASYLRSLLYFAGLGWSIHVLRLSAYAIGK